MLPSGSAAGGGVSSLLPQCPSSKSHPSPLGRGLFRGRTEIARHPSVAKRSHGRPVRVGGAPRTEEDDSDEAPLALGEVGVDVGAGASADFGVAAPKAAVIARYRTPFSCVGNT